MKLKLSFAAIATTILMTSQLCLANDSIEIKGIRLGMNEQQLRSIFEKPTGSIFGVTIGGVYGDVTSSYENDTLVRLNFFFNSNGFETIRVALKEKYPALQCESSTVKNQIGNEFQQIVCNLETTTEVLRISKFTSKITRGMLSLSTKSYLEQMSKELKDKAKSDI